MKIAFLVGRFPVISETFILSQITGLLDRGHEVDIFARERGGSHEVQPSVERYGLLERTYYQPAGRGYAGRLAGGAGVLLRNLHRPGQLLGCLNPFRHGRRALSMELLLAADSWFGRDSYDVVHAHFGPNGALAVALRDVGVLRGRILCTFHGHDVNRYPKLKGAGVYRRLFEAGDRFTVNTAFTADRAVALGCPRDAIVKLPVGLSMSRYGFRESHLSAGEPVQILSVGRLVEKKGLEFSIRAVARAASRFSLEYRIIGDGPLRGPLERLIAELGMEDTIQLLGAMKDTDVLRHYAASHLFLLTSVTAADGDQEGQGLVLQEAQAVGLPVLSTHHNGIPDGVLDGRSGYLVPERDVEALHDRLVELLAHPDRWPAMGRAGRAFVEQNYDIDMLNDALVRIYTELVGD